MNILHGVLKDPAGIEGLTDSSMRMAINIQALAKLLGKLSASDPARDRF